MEYARALVSFLYDEPHGDDASARHYASSWNPGSVPLQPNPLLGLTSGYVQRSIDQFPKQGSKAPGTFVRTTSWIS